MAETHVAPGGRKFCRGRLHEERSLSSVAQITIVAASCLLLANCSAGTSKLDPRLGVSASRA